MNKQTKKGQKALDEAQLLFDSYANIFWIEEIKIMENLWTIIISAILSGILATIITLWWQSKNQFRREKIKIFTVLMSKRYDIAAEESVEALNMIDVVFYNSDKVRAAWKEFNETTKKPESPTKYQEIGDKYLRLLELIAQDIGYNNISWDDIKQYYYPVSLSNKKEDEAMLRKVQINAGLSQIKKSEEHTKSAQADTKDDFDNQMLFKVLENPDAFIKIYETMEKAQNLNNI